MKCCIAGAKCRKI